ncbi:MAG: hypothetical protein ACKO45_05380 [Cyanobium sp.]
MVDVIASNVLTVKRQVLLAGLAETLPRKVQSWFTSFGGNEYKSSRIAARRLAIF